MLSRSSMNVCVCVRQNKISLTQFLFCDKHIQHVILSGFATINFNFIPSTRPFYPFNFNAVFSSNQFSMYTHAHNACNLYALVYRWKFEPSHSPLQKVVRFQNVRSSTTFSATYYVWHKLFSASLQYFLVRLCTRLVHFN